MLEGGVIPRLFKESITCTIKKEGKGNYTEPGLYRPIALENTIAKIVEKVVAEELT
jgi:hypothetical protein